MKTPMIATSSASRTDLLSSLQRPPSSPLFAGSCRFSALSIESGFGSAVLALVLAYLMLSSESSQGFALAVGAGLLAVSPGIAGLIGAEGLRQIRAARSQLEELSGCPAWAAEARASCSDPAGDSISGPLLKKRKYQKLVAEWKRGAAARLQWWHVLSAVAVVLPQIGFLVAVSFDQLRSTSLPRLLLPAAAGLILGAGTVVVNWAVGVHWIRVFDEWCEWASDLDHAPEKPADDPRVNFVAPVDDDMRRHVDEVERPKPAPIVPVAIVPAAPVVPDPPRPAIAPIAARVPPVEVVKVAVAQPEAVVPPKEEIDEPAPAVNGIPERAVLVESASVTVPAGEPCATEDDPVGAPDYGDEK
jgi:hypothetical protein